MAHSVQQNWRMTHRLDAANLSNFFRNCWDAFQETARIAKGTSHLVRPK